MKYGLVTGASRGIGRAISIKLAQNGFSILVNYKNNKTEAQKTIAMIEQHHVKGELLKFDVSDASQVDNCICNWQMTHKDDYIDILVNNAGIRKDNLMFFMDNKEWSDVIATNLNSFYNVTRNVIKGMVSNKHGRIINIVSLSGITGLPGQTNYSASKAGVIGATKALSKELARKKITVNAIAPGFIRTDMLTGLDEKTLLETIPMNRFGESEEVAELVSFLASNKASYITGQIISINGGIN